MRRTVIYIDFNSLVIAKQHAIEIRENGLQHELPCQVTTKTHPTPASGGRLILQKTDGMPFTLAEYKRFLTYAQRCWPGKVETGQTFKNHSF